MLEEKTWKNLIIFQIRKYVGSKKAPDPDRKRGKKSDLGPILSESQNRIRNWLESRIQIRIQD